MDLVVGLDLTPHGDQALRVAHELASAAGSSIGVVHVVTQQALDKTGGLTIGEKRQAANAALYPALWRRVESLIGEDGKVEIDVIVRFAAVHLARAEEHVAGELLAVARDFGAKRVVLGRRGRPDSVAEHILAKGTVEPGAASAIVVRLP